MAKKILCFILCAMFLGCCLAKPTFAKNVTYNQIIGDTLNSNYGGGGSGGGSRSNNGESTNTNNSNKQTTVILNECGSQANSSDGGGILCIVNNVVDIMTAGVGILAVLGIVWVGIQYITSSGNEGKMAIAKKRIVEIAIGLFVYAVFYVLLKFLLPGFSA